jgi:tetratricopeptide (TPR) repeat protein
MGRAEDARRVLQEALDRSGNPVPVALMLAELDARMGATVQAAELLRKVLGDNPGNLPTAQTLARILLDAGRVDEAAKVVADVARNAGESAELTELTGEIFMAQGRYAEAVAAFGPRVLLSARGRWLRRRSWWRSGGPLRHRSTRETGQTAAALVGAVTRTADAHDAALEAITWASWLSDQHRHNDARRVISEALAAHGRHPALLACAARIEDAADAKNTACYLWREALQQAPDDIDVVCGLARCLAYTLVKPSYTLRTSDALRVLDSFPDQSHPEIRTARADVLRSNDAPAARVVAAYGPVDGLPMAAARTRRRLWWRSAWPLGQLCVHTSDRIRGERRARSVSGQVSRTEAESEPVARVLDSLDDLTPSEARERIEEACRQHGRQPSLLLAYADVDDSDQGRWHCLAVAAEAARNSTDSLDTVCALGSAVHATYGYGTALQVLESLPAAARHTIEARVVTGDFHKYAKNFALAVTAYGDPRDLDLYNRKTRRRCARRALPQRLRSSSSGDIDAIDPASFDPVPPAIARVLDQAASLIDEPARLRELIGKAFEEHGRHPLLLLGLAEAERMYGDRHAGAALAAEAMRSAPDDPLIVAESIRELWLDDYDADALRAIADLSEQLTTSPAVRSATGNIYRYWRLPAHAVTAFGRSGLEAWGWQVRRICWWRSGGPVRPIRSSILTRENSLLSDLALPPQQAVALSALPLPAQVADAVRGDLATYHMIRTHLTVFRPEVLYDRLDRMFVPTSTVIVFAALTFAERLRWPSAGIAYCLTAAALATAAEVMALWILGKITQRWVPRICVAVASGISGAFLLRSAGRLASSAGLALSALAFMIVAGFLVRQTALFARRIRAARWQRSEAETGVLSALLDLLGRLIMLQHQRRDATVRRIWMADLEHVAITIDRDLPHALRSGDPGSQSAIAAHARSAATALREMKRIVALPNEASWQDLIEQLTGLATALARHDFGNWPPPLPEVTTPPPPRPLWRQVVDKGRVALVIFLPPLVAYLLPLAIPLSGPGLSWLRFATIVWALLGILVALDPAWTERISKMRQGLDLLRSAAPSKGGDGSAAPYGPADTAPLQTPDVQRQTPARRAHARSHR